MAMDSQVKEHIISSIESQKKHTVNICPCCGSDDCFGVSRVVGYFSIIENWNRSKRAELKRRQKGNYWHEEDD